MIQLDNAQSLFRFVQHHDEEAFRDLVNRHLGLVYASALRQVRNEHDAQDVTQAVFIVLARRAHTIRNPATLPAWLLKATYFATGDLRKLNARRRRREEEVRAMTPDRSSHQPDPEWDKLSPHIDAALARLSDIDRAAVIAHGIQQQSISEIAALLGFTEAAARKRVQRAFAKLRDILGRSGGAPAAMLTSTLQNLLGSRGVSPAPESLFPTITKCALAATQSGTGATVALGIAKGVSRMLFWTPIKITAAVATILTCAASGIVIPVAMNRVAAASNTGRVTPQTQPAPDKGTSTDSFAAAYGLAAGQNVRKIVPPFPKERADFIDQLVGHNNVHRPEILRQTHNLIFRWRGETRVFGGFGYFASFDDLANAMDESWWYQLDHLDRLQWDPGVSDWSVRDSLSLPAFLAGIVPILSADMGYPVDFKESIVRRPFIVLTGAIHDPPKDVGGFLVVAVTVQPLSKSEFNRWLSSTGNPTPDAYTVFSVGQASRQLDAPLVSTVSITNGKFIFTPDARLHWTDRDYRKKLQDIVDNIRAQIGGTWTIEDRDIHVWEPVVK